MNKINLLTMAIFLIVSPKLRAAGPLITLKKQIILPMSMGGEKNVVEKVADCSINDNGQSRMKMDYHGVEILDKKNKLSSKDHAVLKKALESFSKNSGKILTEKDYTGHQLDPIGITRLKSDDGYIYKNGKKTVFYNMKRTLIQRYDGPGFDELKTIIRKYCDLDI